MMCDDCNHRPATRPYKEFMMDGKVIEYNLCDDCAKKRGITGHKKLTPLEILQKLLKEKNAHDEQIICPECFLSLAEFKRIGRFGCGHCISVFEPYIKNLINEIHHADRHVGKKLKTGERKGLEIYRLREDLKKAIEKEAYEEAAKIRDKLKSLDQEHAE
jgi:protein arginine kinase activator